MPKASKDTASEHEAGEGYGGHFEHFEGGWTEVHAAELQVLSSKPEVDGAVVDR
jgi:hypothetical protein